MGNDNSLQYIELREKYPDFIFERYDISDKDGALNIVFHFSIPGLARFCPTWSFPMPGSQQPFIDRHCLDGLVFSLGMAELISYWKTCCPPNVRVEAGTLTPPQIAWWKKLYSGGLGEYFYTNGISPGDSFMDIISPMPASIQINNPCAADTTQDATQDTLDRLAASGNRRDAVPGNQRDAASGNRRDAASRSTQSTVPESTRSTASEGLPKVLIPIGGGKDSAVTLELLRGCAERFGYAINPRQATDDTAAVGGIEKGNMIAAKRTLDKNMLKLNAQGYLNGHTPFSAIVAFSSIIAGYINGLQYVALSNESSANEATIANSKVNHQYSKSFEFETDFRRYEREYIGAGVEYFSLLRPLSELQIGRLFAKYRQYHKVFRSCNAGSKQDEWCGVCSKCLFVYIILAPFLEEGELVSIFQKNIFEDISLKEKLDELVGFTPEKPFECVGRRDEVYAALELTIAGYAEQAKPLPALLAYYYAKRSGAPFGANTARQDDYDTENAVPQRFLALIKDAAKEGSY